MKYLCYMGAFLFNFTILVTLYEILSCIRESETNNAFVWLAIIISGLYSTRVFIEKE